MTTAPKAFLSHATEDKQRFAVPFATALRDKGIDVWLDQWEIKPGDSLVKKVFTDGISEASVFIIVLSPVSITKPWVAEELDAAVVRRLSGEAKIIPVVLDHAAIPDPLRHLLWVDEAKHGLDGTVAEVVRSVFNLNVKPPLGQAPAYHSQPAKNLVGDAQDDAVLALAFDSWLEKHGGWVTRDEVIAKAAPLEIVPHLVDESVQLLGEEHFAKVTRVSGGQWFITGFPAHAVAQLFMAKGIDAEGISRRLLTSIVNHPSQRIGEFEDTHPLLLRALIDGFEARGYVTGMWLLGGPFVITSVSPRASRDLREG